eukprot:Skav206180  [mRNA]  locus=scaffold1844:55105:60272:- [translate_table: standard]
MRSFRTLGTVLWLRQLLEMPAASFTGSSMKVPDLRSDSMGKLDSMGDHSPPTLGRIPLGDACSPGDRNAKQRIFPANDGSRPSGQRHRKSQQLGRHSVVQDGEQKGRVSGTRHAELVAPWHC